MSTSEVLRRMLEIDSLAEAVITALVFAWIAGRLLGVGKRSWRSVVLAGGAGWVGAVFMTAALIEGGPDNPDFRVLYVLLTLVFVMLATVVIEVWVKPGRVRVGRTWSIPHPIRVIKRRYRLSRRLGEITRIMVRNGLGGYLGMRRSRRAAEPEPTAALAARARVALEEAGGMFVKLGQLLAGRGDLIGEEIAAEFARLQDAVPPASPEAVRRLVEEELGRPIEEVFSSFDLVPVGAASIGQAHLARRVSGEQVIVKVRRPGVAEMVDRDLQIIERLAAIADTRTAWGPAYGIKSLAEDFASSLRQELDYRIEASNAAQIQAAISYVELVHVPEIDRELSTSRIMVMELLDGVPLTKVDASTKWPIDRESLAEAIMRALVEPIFSGERFHADPHPGNVFLMRDGRLGLVDFGATGRLDAFEQAAVTDIMIGLQTRDPEMLREAILSVGTLRRPVDGLALERSLARFMAKHVSTGADLSSDMLNELLQMLAFFGIVLPASTGAMFRALVTLEGTVEAIRPGFSIMDAAQRIGGDLVREQYGEDQLKELAQQEAIKLAPVLRRLPRHADRIAAMMQRGELTGRVSLFSVDRDVTFLRDLFGRAVLLIVGAALMFLSMLLLRMDMGPALSDDTSLLQVFGYIGLFLGFILLLRVTVVALRDTGAGERPGR